MTLLSSLISPLNSGIYVRYLYSASSAQTTFSGSDVNGLTLSYKPGYVEVYLNGMLLPTTDYTATDGVSIVFPSGLSATDVVYIVALSTLTISDTYLKSQSGADVSNTLLFRSNIGAAASPGTWSLTDLGSGSGTYTTKANCKAIWPVIVGGGGGGGGGGTNVGGQAGGQGGTTTFGSMTAGGGAAGGGAGAGPAQGGSASGGNLMNIAGSWAAATFGAGGASTVYQAGMGADSRLGGGGYGGWIGSGGSAGQPNTGGGGGGGGITGGGSAGQGGGGGGAGGYSESFITISLASSYSYAVGAGGTAGAAGTNGMTGAAGGSGYIFILELF